MTKARSVCINVQARSGHRLKYVRHLALETRARGNRTVLVGPPGTLGSAEMMSHLGDLGDSLRVIEAEIRYVADLLQIADGIGCHRLVLLDGDKFLPEFASMPWLRTSYEVRILVMRTSVPRSGNASTQVAKTLVKRIMMWIINRSTRIRAIELRPASWVGSSRSPVVRDPIDVPLRSSLPPFELGRELYWFGVFGAITPRKNLGLIARALSHRSVHPVGLLILGKFEEGLREALEIDLELLRESGCEVMIVDSVVSHETLCAGISAVSCVVVAHSNEGPSGIFSLALAYGTPVLAAGAQSLKEEVEACGDRAFWVPLDSSSLTNGMNDVIKREVGFDPPPLASPDEFAKGLLD